MRKSLHSLFLGTFIFNGFWLIPIAAQEHKSTITGRVLDTNQGALMGARVGLQPTPYIHTCSLLIGLVTFAQMAILQSRNSQRAGRILTCR